MAKSRKKMPRKKEVTESRTKTGRRSRLAYVFICIAAVFLLINGLIVMLFSGRIAEMVQDYSSIVTTTGSWITYGVIWLALAFLLWVTLKRIEETGLKSEKWLLFGLGIITAISGRLESGVLVLIAAIIYLRQK